MKSNLIGVRRDDLVTVASKKPQPIDEQQGTIVSDIDPARPESPPLPHVRHDLISRVYQGWEDKRAAEQRPFRPKLGASDIGNQCARSVWYTWRHAMKRNLPGKLLRLFNRGHREEPVIEEEFGRIGMPISTAGADGGQHGFGDDTGHWRVNLDGIVTDPTDGRQFIIEMKTMSRYSFKMLDSKGGVRYSHPHYYAQIMAQAATAESHVRVDAALFVAVCKDTDELWIEEVAIDQEAKAATMLRVRQVIGGALPPMPLDCAPSTGPCRFCDYKPICRENKAHLVEKSCRTCDHAEAVMGGQWRCAAGEPFGTPCDKWVMHRGFCA